jgi:hypothetical protein
LEQEPTRIDYVSAKNSIHPHRGALAQDDIADKLSGNIDIATGGKLRPTALVAADHGRKTSGALRPLGKV